MMNILSRLDKTEVFCDADDFYQDFEQNYQNQLKLLTDDQRKLCQREFDCYGLSVSLSLKLKCDRSEHDNFEFT